ncbi:glycosyltransferase [Ornithinimicrobium sp. F0845]|uniref:glycosyltransferase n=1 Tax=Ornithinimicrobium sp. F0845 TaxID=2926412 RepID=UPI001FF11688|nr:glycosyltransferase [Ornithinimicrobium sp. F0845]
MNVSVVIPCYASERTLPDLVAGLHDALGGPAHQQVEDYEVILVVDGSPDATFAVARELERESPRVRALMLHRNYGQHNALLAGILRARYEVVVTMDDDLQHRPTEVHKLLAPLADPLVDLVYGVPVVEEHGFWRSLASRSVKAGLALADVPNANDVSAFRAFRTQLRSGFGHAADAFVSIDVVLSWTTLGVRRVDVEMDERTIGQSNYGFRRLIRHTLNMVTGYGTVPLRLVTWLGIACFILGMGLLAFTLWGFVVGRTTVTGFTTLASMIALFSGAQMLSVGILGEYVGRLHFRSMHKPTFLVRVDGEPGRVDDPRRAGHVDSSGGQPPDVVAEALNLRHHPDDGSSLQ